MNEKNEYRHAQTQRVHRASNYAGTHYVRMTQSNTKRQSHTNRGERHTRTSSIYGRVLWIWLKPNDTWNGMKWHTYYVHTEWTEEIALGRWQEIALQINTQKMTKIPTD